MRRGARLALPLVALLIPGAIVSAADTTVEIQNVTVRSWAFQPATIQISAGETVTWVDRSAAGSEPHTVTPDVPGAFTGSPILRPGDQHVVTFATTGEFRYHCEIHPDMLGTVVVFPATPPPSAPSPAVTPQPSAPPAPTPAATGTVAAPATVVPATASPATAAPATITPTVTPAASPAASGATSPIPPAPDRGVLPFAAIILAAVLALLLGRRAYRRGR